MMRTVRIVALSATFFKCLCFTLRPCETVATRNICRRLYPVEVADGPFSPIYSSLLTTHENLDKYFEMNYKYLSKIKCPFFRRRAFDFIDNFVMVVEFLISRHKTLHFLPALTVPGCASIKSIPRSPFTSSKSTGLPIDKIANIIEHDWLGNTGNGKGYYITGCLSDYAYRDDCVFDGPDPDMPVRGLRKYISAAANLFDRKKSRADLKSLTIDRERNKIYVTWRLEGILNLPWHPTLKPFTGKTTYTLDAESLVAYHSEEWDISVVDAFMSVLIPSLPYGAPPAPACHSTVQRYEL